MCKIRCPLCRKRICDIIATVEGRTVVRIRCPTAEYVFGVRVYEDHFEWLLNLDTETRGELDDVGSPVYFKKLTVTPDDERAWFKAHP